MRTLKTLLSLLLVVFLPCPAIAEGWQEARMGIGFVGGGVTAGCITCSGGLIFTWYCNSTTVGDIAYSPCGCSTGDTSATANGSVEITGGYVLTTDSGVNGADYYSFDVSGIFNKSAGSIVIEMEVNTWVNWGNFFSVGNDANNSLILETGNANDLRLIWTAGTDFYVDTTAINPNQVATNTKYWVVFRWTTSGVDPNLELRVYDTTETEIVGGTNNNNLTAMTDPVGEVFFIGNRAAVNLIAKIYSIRIYNTYAGAPSSGF